MAKQNGALIKETRKAAGMSQEALSKASGVSVKDISKVERGIEDLAPEKLEAVAKALDVAPESLLLPEAPLTDDEKELLELYRSADAGTQKAATSALKGEAQQSQDPMSAMMSMFGGMMGGGAAAGGEGAAAGGEGAAAGGEGAAAGGDAGANPMAAMMSMFGGGAGAGGEGGDAGSNPMAAMMGMFGGMMGGAAPAGEQKEAPADAPAEEPKTEE